MGWNLSETLPAVRNARGLTQEQLGELADLRRTDISAIENGKPVGEVRLQRLVDALKVSRLELVPEAETDQPGQLLQDRQAELEVEVLRLAGEVTRLVRRVRALERRLPPGSPEAGKAAR